MPAWTDDYTRSRTVGVAPPYAVDDKIGRQDSVDRVATTSMTATATQQLLPATPLGRRNHIIVQNIGATTVAIVDSSTTAAADGIQIAAGAEWSETTDAVLYVISTGADSAIRVYERATADSAWNGRG